MQTRETGRKRSYLAAILCAVAIVAAGAPADSAERFDASVFYQSQNQRRFLSIGPDEAQFAPWHYDSIANNYGLVILNKGFRTMPNNYEAARQIRRRNPNIVISAYYNTKIWYDANYEDWAEPGFDPAESFDRRWLLRDKDGNLVPQRKDGVERDNAFMIDVSNPHYRAWALAVMDRWMRNGPFGGIHFDSGTDYVDGFDGRNWSRFLAPGKMEALNVGIKALQTETKRRFSDKVVTYNGIGYKRDDDDLAKLAYLDGATREAYCVGQSDSGGAFSEHLNDDIAIMASHPNDLILLHASYRGEESAHAAEVGRYCLGNFLMGWQPGSTYLKFGLGSYGTEVLEYDLPELNLDLGHPSGSYSRHGTLLTRNFQRGFVVVNQGSTSQTINVLSDVMRVKDGAVIDTLEKNDGTTIGRYQGAFFMYRDAAPSQGDTTSSSPPTFPGGGTTTVSGSPTSEPIGNGSSEFPSSTAPSINFEVANTSTDETSPVAQVLTGIGLPIFMLMMTVGLMILRWRKEPPWSFSGDN